jgi:hypothetical protein
MNQLKLSTANLVILIAGAVMLIASFLDFTKAKATVTFGNITIHVSTGGGNAWSSGRFLIATIPALLGIVMAAHVAVDAFASGVKPPEKVLGLSWNQIHLVLGLQATIMMLAFLIQSTSPLDKGIGLFLMLLAAIALLVGAVLRMQEPASGSVPPGV